MGAPGRSWDPLWHTLGTKPTKVNHFTDSPANTNLSQKITFSVGKCNIRFFSGFLRPGSVVQKWFGDPSEPQKSNETLEVLSKNKVRKRDTSQKRSRGHQKSRKGGLENAPVALRGPLGAQESSQESPRGVQEGFRAQEASPSMFLNDLKSSYFENLCFL